MNRSPVGRGDLCVSVEHVGEHRADGSWQGHDAIRRSGDVDVVGQGLGVQEHRAREQGGGRHETDDASPSLVRTRTHHDVGSPVRQLAVDDGSRHRTPS